MSNTEFILAALVFIMNIGNRNFSQSISFHGECSDKCSFDLTVFFLLFLCLLIGFFYCVGGHFKKQALQFYLGSCRSQTKQTFSSVNSTFFMLFDKFSSDLIGFYCQRAFFLDSGAGFFANKSEQKSLERFKIFIKKTLKFSKHVW